MRKVWMVLSAALLVAGCGNSGGEPSSCSNDAQKQFVLDALYDWYLWNDDLPANLDIANYDSPEQLVFEVTTAFGPRDNLGNPIDRWSSVRSLQADEQFFGAGRYEGFGFTWAARLTRRALHEARP